MPAGKKLLVADDSLTIQKVIRLALSNEGYEIQAISDGGDAIQQIATFRPDAVLIDVSLPTRSAFEIKREVNGMPDNAHTRFILMSSAFEKIDEAQAKEVAFDAHLTKPFDPAHLRQTLSEVLVAAPTAPPPPPSEPAHEEPIALAPEDSTSFSIQLDPPMNLPPSDFEVAAPPPPRSAAPSEDELWGKYEATPPAPPSSNHDEIRELTESTIRMSGLADLPQDQSEEFAWKVNEPSMKPPSSIADLGESSFQFDSHSFDSHSSELSAPPPFPESHSFENPLDMPEMPKIPKIPKIPKTTAQENEPSPNHGFSDFAGSQAFEETMRRQIQETLEKMAREILPEVAERVIKAEITKLLNEKL